MFFIQKIKKAAFTIVKAAVYNNRSIINKLLSRILLQ